jgi:hypothetical protein
MSDFEISSVIDYTRPRVFMQVIKKVFRDRMGIESESSRFHSNKGREEPKNV